MADDIPEILASTTAYAGRIVRVRLDDLRYADGGTHRCEIVEHPGSIGIIALTAGDELVLVRQYRHPARRVLWEIPAGTAEPGEAPAVTAARELAEETGYRAAELHPLWSVFMTPGFCDEYMHFFVAHGLEAGQQSLDPDERIDVGTFSLARATEMLAAGAIADVKTLLALHWLGSSHGELRSGSRR